MYKKRCEKQREKHKLLFIQIESKVNSILGGSVSQRTVNLQGDREAIRIIESIPESPFKFKSMKLRYVSKENTKDTLKSPKKK